MSGIIGDKIIKIGGVLMGKKFNKGEWSEFYAFMHILANGKLYAADENRNKNANRFYHILSAIKKDIEYHRNTEEGNIVFEFGENEIRIPIKDFQSKLANFFRAIEDGKRTFEVPLVEPLIEELQIESIKERSDSKGDIRLRIHDELVGFDPIHSFSVKSYVGGDPTLLNASNGTVFEYEITPKLSDIEVGQINGLKGQRGWLDNVIKEIHEFGGKLNYKSLSSSIFEDNLRMVDYRLPELLANVLVEGYLVKNKKLSLAVESFLEKNPDEKDRIIKYKIKELLTASALGMVPMTEWDGMDEANGGYIIVKENAEVLCYHLYERNELKEYLYNNTRFETPSTSRYGLGKIDKDSDNNQIISLGLQIRF